MALRPRTPNASPRWSRASASAKFVEPRTAKKELEAIGLAALDALRKAAKDENLETAKRAQELVRKIEDRILTADLLNPVVPRPSQSQRQARARGGR
ncbi:MAG: hypothetical protein U0793_15090 [Gemmataceae bacterium]